MLLWSSGQRHQLWSHPKAHLYPRNGADWLGEDPSDIFGPEHIPDSHLNLILADFLQVQDGTAAASFQLADIDLKLQKHMSQTLHKLQQKGSQLYVRVIVTNVQSKVTLIL